MILRFLIHDNLFGFQQLLQPSSLLENIPQYPLYFIERVFLQGRIMIKMQHRK